MNQELTDTDLNRLCAEKIFDTERRMIHFSDMAGTATFAVFVIFQEKSINIKDFLPLTKPAHNEILLDQMVELGWLWTIETGESNGFFWIVKVGQLVSGKIFYAHNPDRKRAIVMACLKAVGAI